MVHFNFNKFVNPPLSLRREQRFYFVTPYVRQTHHSSIDNFQILSTKNFNNGYQLPAERICGGSDDDDDDTESYIHKRFLTSIGTAQQTASETQFCITTIRQTRSLALGASSIWVTMALAVSAVIKPPRTEQTRLAYSLHLQPIT